MNRRYRIRTLLLFGNLSILFIGFVGITLISSREIASSAQADYQGRLGNEIRLIAQALSPTIHAFVVGDVDGAALDAALEPYAQQTNGVLHLFFTGRENLQNPDAARYKLPIDRLPEEVKAAMGGGAVMVVARPNPEGIDTLNTAASVNYDGEPTGLLQLSVPLANLNQTIAERWGTLALWMALVLGLTGVFAYLFARSITRPLSALQASALRLAQGDMAHRVQVGATEELHAVGLAFNEMAHQVQSLLEEQRAFASNAAHELRTPLTTIQLRIEAVGRVVRAELPALAGDIETVESEVLRLNHLVRGLSVLSRLDAGRFERGQDTVDIGRFAAALCKQVSAHADEKGVTVRFIPPAQPSYVMVNLTHLEMVFRNVLDNALKYTSSGGMVTWAVTADGATLHHTLTDDGQGIAPDDLSRLFERFYRADKARSQDVPGTGLGLSLARSIIEAYGGHITITSAGLGAGTTVSIDWPLATLEDE